MTIIKSLRRRVLYSSGSNCGDGKGGFQSKNTCQSHAGSGEGGHTQTRQALKEDVIRRNTPSPEHVGDETHWTVRSDHGGRDPLAHIRLFPEPKDGDNGQTWTVTTENYAGYGPHGSPTRYGYETYRESTPSRKTAERWATKEVRAEAWAKYQNGEMDKSGLPAEATRKAHEDRQMYARSESRLIPGNDRSSDPGVMIALHLPMGVARKVSLSSPGAESPSSLHITLAYLGRLSKLGEGVSAQQATIAKVANILRAVGGISRSLSGSITGVGRFTGSESSGGKDVIYAGVDVPGLVELRHRICQSLKAFGIPYSQDHGFTPHVTLAYVEPGEASPVARIPSHPVSFGSVGLTIGDDRQSFPLVGRTEYERKSGTRPMPENLSDKIKRILYCKGDVACAPCASKESSADHIAMNIVPDEAEVETPKRFTITRGAGGKIRISYAASQSTPLKSVGGKLVSARSKSGSPACSQAASDWRTGRADKSTYVTLAQCRAQAATKHAAKLHSIAGNEGHAQHLEHIAASTHVTKKERASRAAELKGQHNAELMDPNSGRNNRAFDAGVARRNASAQAKRTATGAVVQEHADEHGQSYADASLHGFHGSKKPSIIAAERTAKAKTEAAKAPAAATGQQGAEAPAAAQPLSPKEVSDIQATIARTTEPPTNWVEQTSGGWIARDRGNPDVVPTTFKSKGEAVQWAANNAEATHKRLAARLAEHRARTQSQAEAPAAAPAPAPSPVVARPARGPKDRIDKLSQLLDKIPHHKERMAGKTGEPASGLYNKNAEVLARENQLKATRKRLGEKLSGEIGALTGGGAAHPEAPAAAPSREARKASFNDTVRQSQADQAAGRFPGLDAAKAAGNSYRKSPFRPSPGTPKFRQQVAQAVMERDDKRLSRAEAKKGEAAPKVTTQDQSATPTPAPAPTPSPRPSIADRKARVLGKLEATRTAANKGAEGTPERRQAFRNAGRDVVASGAAKAAEAGGGGYFSKLKAIREKQQAAAGGHGASAAPTPAPAAGQPKAAEAVAPAPEAVKPAPAAPAPLSLKEQIAARRDARGETPEHRGEVAGRRRVEHEVSNRSRINLASDPNVIPSRVNPDKIGARVGDTVYTGQTISGGHKEMQGKVTARYKDRHGSYRVDIRRPDGKVFKGVPVHSVRSLNKDKQKYTPERQAKAEELREKRKGGTGETPGGEAAATNAAPAPAAKATPSAPVAAPVAAPAPPKSTLAAKSAAQRAKVESERASKPEASQPSPAPASPARAAAMAKQTASQGKEASGQATATPSSGEQTASAPGPIPDRIKDFVKGALGTYKDRAENIRRGAAIANNPTVGGGRRYVDDTRRNVGRPAAGDVRKFIGNADKNGIPGKAAVKEIAKDVLPRTKGDPLAGVRSVKPDAGRAQEVLDKVRGRVAADASSVAPGGGDDSSFATEPVSSAERALGAKLPDRESGIERQPWEGQGTKGPASAATAMPTAAPVSPRTSPVPGLPKQPHEMNPHELQHHYDRDPEFAKAWDSRYAGSPVNPLYHSLYLQEAQHHGAKVPEHLLPGGGKAPGGAAPEAAATLALAPAATPQPSLKEQVDARRATKGDRANRLRGLADKAQAREFDLRHRASQLRTHFDVADPAGMERKKSQAGALIRRANESGSRSDRLTEAKYETPPAAKGGAAPEAQPPAPATPAPSPAAIPDEVKDHVKQALGSYKERAANIRRGADLARNPTIGGGRRYVDDTRSNKSNSVARDKGDIKDFIAAAKENGVEGKAAVKEIAKEVLPRTKGDPLAGVRSVKPDAKRAQEVLGKVRGRVAANAEASSSPATTSPAASPSLKDQVAAKRATKGTPQERAAKLAEKLSPRASSAYGSYSSASDKAAAVKEQLRTVSNPNSKKADKLRQQANAAEDEAGRAGSQYTHVMNRGNRIKTAAGNVTRREEGAAKRKILDAQQARRSRYRDQHPGATPAEEATKGISGVSGKPTYLGLEEARNKLAETKKGERAAKKTEGVKAKPEQPSMPPAPAVTPAEKTQAPAPSSGRPSLRDQVEAKRQASNLTPEQRKARAAGLYSWWAGTSPTRQFSGSNTSKREKASRDIEELQGEHLPVIQQAHKEAVDRAERLKSKRETPKLELSPSGPKLTAKEYNNWGQATGKTKAASDRDEPRYYRSSTNPDETARYFQDKPTWDADDVRVLKNHVKVKEAQGQGDHPDVAQLRDRLREYERIGKAKPFPQFKADKASKPGKATKAKAAPKPKTSESAAPPKSAEKASPEPPASPAAQPKPTSAYEEHIAKTTNDLRGVVEKHMSNEVSPGRKAMAAMHLLHGEPPEVQKRLAQHLFDNHPDVYRAIKEAPGRKVPFAPHAFHHTLAPKPAPPDPYRG